MEYSELSSRRCEIQVLIVIVFDMLKSFEIESIKNKDNCFIDCLLFAIYSKTIRCASSL